MIVTAILAIRNEEAYLANCLHHLVHNQINFVIIDNGSNDASAEIYRRREFAAHLVDVKHVPFQGAFSLTEQLQHKLEAVDAVKADWVIHLDADEVMHSYRPDESLSAALSRLNAEGWNAVNFDEFVFLPIENNYRPEAPGWQQMSLYYFFEPDSPRLMRAWRKASGLSMLEHGGHLLAGSNLRLAPEHFALRHYIVRSQEHAFEKYTARRFASHEIDRGWHANRIGHLRESFALPSINRLKRLPVVADRTLERDDPWQIHYWQVERNWNHEHVATS